MSIVTASQRIPKESFKLACRICEQKNPSITYDMARYFGTQMNKLILSNAFISGRVKCLMGRSGNFEIVTYHNKRPGYFERNNFIEVSFNNIKNYNLDLNWIVKAIGNNISTYPAQEIIPNFLWQIGNFNAEVPIFFARRITKDDVFTKISKALNDRKSIRKGIVLTSCDLPNYFCDIAGHQSIALDKCLTHDKNFHINKDILKASIKSKKEGFSNGYRSACFNNEYFRFTKQESEILEFLDKAGKPIHKDEIMAEITKNNTEIKMLFRNESSKNIRQTILQYDKKGYYWINLT